MKNIVLILFGVLVCAIGILGESLQSNALRYYIPGLLHATVAMYATWSFFVNKKDYSMFLIWVGWFVWYYFQLLLPTSGMLIIEMMDGYGTSGRIWGIVSGGITPVLLYIGTNAWQSTPQMKSFKVWLTVPLGENSIRRGYLTILIWSMFLIIPVGLVYLVTADLIMGSIHIMKEMRNTEIGTGFEAFGGAMGSFIALVSMAPAVLIIILFLVFSIRNIWIRIIACVIVLPVPLIWCLGLLLSGTRTYIVAFGGVIIIWLCVKIKFNLLKLSIIGLIFVSILIIAQTTYLYRNTGLSNFDFDETIDKIMDIQGLETLADQSRCFYYIMEEPEGQWFDVDPVSGFFIGLVHRPLEYSYYLIPRSIWHGKPLDPTFTDYTRFSLILAGYSDLPFVLTEDGKDTGYGTSNTTGFLGRDVIRYGPLGAISIIIWYSLFLAFGDLFFELSRRNPYSSWIAAAIAGTCFAMWRGPEPTWALLLMPCALIIFLGYVAAVKHARSIMR
ncbi:MAG: hypothetical protein SFY80_12605 [Verrucomicrobiota bacterium]|nr:hypothetical protein [Verrucomicrobiota bacterium]